MFVTGLGGAAALSRDSTSSPSPLRFASYDGGIGPALSATAGYHFNNWISAQAGYTWNQSRVKITQLTGIDFAQREQTGPQHSVGADLLVYFRPRNSRVRPYLSAGPAWSRVDAQNKPALRVAVGVDLLLKQGWGVRYTFTETMSASPYGAALNPPGKHGLMNFQNLVGVIKVF